MRLRLLVPALAVLLAALPVLAAPATPAPAPAREVVEGLLARAKASGRSPLVLFHASWCGWCRKLERTLARPEVKPILEKHFETAWLQVQERAGKKSLENPGGNELLASWGAAEAGLPFYAVLDGKGAVVASALMRGPDGKVTGASGFPGTAEEIDHFLAMVGKGAPRISRSELDTLRKAFPVLVPSGAAR